MGNFAKNLNLGNRFRPPPPVILTLAAAQQFKKKKKKKKTCKVPCTWCSGSATALMSTVNSLVWFSQNPSEGMSIHATENKILLLMNGMQCRQA